MANELEPTDETAGAPRKVPLSVLIDRMCADLEARDAAFVRRFSQWMHEHSGVLRLEPIAVLGLEDVVVTFQMKRRVSLVITGYVPRDQPGSVTVVIGEDEFPFVNVILGDEQLEDPYEICTMDYSFADRPVRIRQGHHADRQGRIVVAATVGLRQTTRVRLDTGEVVTVEAAALDLQGET